MSLLSDIMTKEFLLKCLEEGLTQREIAEKVNKEYGKRVSRSSVFYWLRRHGLASGKRRFVYPDLDYTEMVERSDIVNQTINKINNYINNKKVNISDNKHEYNLNILISDVHAGYYYDRIGRVDYKTVIHRRFENLSNKTVSRIAEYGKPKNIIINILGDLVDGTSVYPEQGEFVEGIILNQVNFIIEELTNFIIKILPFSVNNVYVYCVAGNHGRIKNYRVTNWDNFVYLTLQKVFNSLNEYGLDKKVLVTFSERSMLLYNEPDFHWKKLISHGHFIVKKSALSNIRDLMKEISIKNFTGDLDFDVLMLGHVHQARVYPLGNTKWFVSNGTMYDSLHFTHEIGYPSSLVSVVYTSTHDVPVDTVFMIQLEEKEYYEGNRPMIEVV